MTGFFRTVGEELKKAYKITKTEGYGYGGKSVSTITGKEYACLLYTSPSPRDRG